MMQTALRDWGEAAQAYQTIEECAELIVALNKQVTRMPTADSLEHILDEIADVEMMLAQMRLTFGISDEMLAKRIMEKFERLEKYLKDSQQQDS
jgi:NTP pyrophosphatase (non-canonical NTP hydrolase)